MACFLTAGLDWSWLGKPLNWPQMAWAVSSKKRTGKTGRRFSPLHPCFLKRHPRRHMPYNAEGLCSIRSSPILDTEGLSVDTAGHAGAIWNTLLKKGSCCNANRGCDPPQLDKALVGSLRSGYRRYASISVCCFIPHLFNNSLYFLFSLRAI